MNFRHIAIDMQRLLVEDTAWYSPTVAAIVPNVAKLSEAFRHVTLYARFVAPHDVEDAEGCWKAFYRRWPMIIGKVLDPALLELVEPLSTIAEPSQIFDKSGFSIFSSPELEKKLRASSIDTLILSGTETDVCVYSSALAAVDLGYNVVLAADAMTSPDHLAHRSVIETLAPRLPEQIRIMDTAAILNAFETIALA